MKKLIATAMFMALLISPTAFAQDAAATEDSKSEWPQGFILQGGLNAGYEFTFYKSPNYGLSTALGYQADRFGFYLRNDVHYTRKNGANHFNVTLMPTFRAFVYEGAYAFAGVGYNWVHARRGSTLPRVTLLVPTSYHLFTAEAGGGYEHLFKENFGIVGELGLNYSLFNQNVLNERHMFRPILRVMASFYF